MKTLIFDSFTDFLNREDKKTNGVSKTFAENNPNYSEDNKTNDGCWNCSDCSDCSDCRGCSDCSGCRDCSGCSDCSDCSGCRDCSGCSDCSYCSGCRDCSYCSGCRDCSGCSDCSDCSGCRDCSYCSGCRDCSGCSDCSDCSGCRDCSGCSDCSDCSDLKSNEEKLNIPVIEKIHQTVLQAVCNDGALNMNEWHTCDTTHCRAGWVVTLAGKEGKELEEKTSTEFAALQIYKKSSDIRVSPTQFYKSNEEAMLDIERCANEEKEKNNNE